MHWKVLRSEVLCQTSIFDVRRDHCRADSNGQEHDFHVLETRDWVNVVPITEDNHVIMVRQFRHGIRALTLEVPAGVIDAEDLQPSVAAARELREETGYACERLVPIGVVHPNPAILSNRCHMYVGEAARRVGEPQWDGTEELVVESYRLDEVPELIRSGAISNALTLVAFQLAELWRRR